MGKHINASIKAKKETELLKDKIIEDAIRLTDLGIYEEVNIISPASWMLVTNTELHISSIISYTMKNTKPNLTINDIKIQTGLGTVISDKCIISELVIDTSIAKITFKVIDISTIFEIKNSGVKVEGTCFISCNK